MLPAWKPLSPWRTGIRFSVRRVRTSRKVLPLSWRSALLDMAGGSSALRETTRRAVELLMAESADRGELTGRVAFVTGGGGGLGRQFAKTLARNGATGIVAGRRHEALGETVREITSAGDQAAAYPLDVCDANAITAVIGQCEARFGAVDILVNNAEIVDSERAERLSLELIDRVIDTNFRAPFLLATEVARRLLAANKP